MRYGGDAGRGIEVIGGSAMRYGGDADKGIEVGGRAMS